MRVKISSAVGDAYPEEFEQLSQDRQSLAVLAKNRVSANVDHRASPLASLGSRMSTAADSPMNHHDMARISNEHG